MIKPTKYEWHINSEPVYVRQTVREILTFLDEHIPGQTPEERSDLRLIFNELLLNAVIHGNASDTHKHVHVRLFLNRGLVRASIIDEGSGYDVAETLSRKDDDLLRESGRGMQLVCALADQVTFGHGGRRVTFEKKIGKWHG